jgi:hypothetical protein
MVAGGVVVWNAKFVVIFVRARNVSTKNFAT